MVDRRRRELMDPADAAWAKQPYHAAAGLHPEDAEDVVRSAIAAAHAHHQAEGELFRDALAAAATRAGLGVMGIREKELEVRADEALRVPPQQRSARLAEAGRRAGTPWGRDQKEAALAAWIALRGAAR